MLTLRQDLQAKYRHFQVADSRRYLEVFDMKVDEVKNVLSQLLKADKIVHEQQLGLLWFPPSQAALDVAFDEARSELTIGF
jgi:dynein regulatry complex protein 1